MNKTEAIKHINSGLYRAELAHPKISGFHLQKMKKGGKYRLRYTMPDESGKRKLITLGKYLNGEKDRIDAQTLALEYIAMIKKGIDPAIEIEKQIEQNKQHLENKKLEAAKKITVGEYLNSTYKTHLKRKKHEGKPTLNRLNNTFNEWLTVPIVELKNTHVNRWQTEFEKEHAYSTCQHVYGLFKTMLNHAVSNEVIDSNPLQRIKLVEPTYDEQQKLQDSETANNRVMFTNDELKAINKAVETYQQQIVEQRESSIRHGKKHLPSFKHLRFPHWFFPLFRLAAYTGMRVGDLYNLNWHHINLSDKRLVKIPNKTQHHRDPAKLDLYLDDSILGVLHDWHQQQGKPKSGLVFPSPTTGKELTRKAHENHWKNIMKIAGLEESIVFYSLRHHFISRLVESNVPLFTIAKLVGHKSTEMIEKNYAKVSQESAQRSIMLVSNDFA